jgi:hypothetical protein
MSITKAVRMAQLSHCFYDFWLVLPHTREREHHQGSFESLLCVRYRYRGSVAQLGRVFSKPSPILTRTS